MIPTGVVTLLAAISKLRVPEKLLLGFLCYLTLRAALFPLDGRQLIAVIVLNGLAAAVILVTSHCGQSGGSRFLTTLRDWIPSVLILVAYRESGLFFAPDPSNRLDYFFIRYDDVILKKSLILRILHSGSPWIQHYLELSYFLCYPIVPLGLASLYLIRKGSPPGVSPAQSEPGPEPAPGYGAAPGFHAPAVEHFWTAVLLASFTCYLLFPFFPLAPPRELFNDVPGPRVAPLLRMMNHWILGKYAVGASLFPSAHVAATAALALVVRRYLPRLGWVFIVVALSIAVATVYGRYHYAVDAAAGAVVGIAAYFVSCRLVKSN